MSKCLHLFDGEYFRHFRKGIKKKLIKASKQVKCQILVDWLKSIVNMLWWALGTSEGMIMDQFDVFN